MPNNTLPKKTGNTPVVILIILLVVFILLVGWIKVRRNRLAAPQTPNYVQQPQNTVVNPTAPPQQVYNQSIESQLSELDTDAIYLDQTLNDKPIDVMSE